ncbi:hypothetical protein [Actinoplanes flavus]|uniref:Uncharacterized protein n=1 Tax=Actinoplanes flavus TaxID=2820290 RepID=A0ABS3UD06_9ACTN|nr:hypothetical protein [Actinoplanes flavus]MBO3736613.1 hypothetical protein [Actinoplanes flavus]
MATLIADFAWRYPAATWLVPDARRRRPVLQGCLKILIDHARRFGYVDVLDDHSAAAIWLDRTQPIPAPTDSARRLAQVCGDDTEAARLLLDITARCQPPIPHLQLVALATDDPDAAATLLAYRHSRLDRLGVASAAYASTQAQLGLLMDAGYQPTEPVWLPAGPPLWPTLRAAVTPGAATSTRRPAA